MCNLYIVAIGPQYCHPILSPLFVTWYQSSRFCDLALSPAPQEDRIGLCSQGQLCRSTFFSIRCATPPKAYPNPAIFTHCGSHVADRSSGSHQPITDSTCCVSPCHPCVRRGSLHHRRPALSATSRGLESDRHGHLQWRLYTRPSLESTPFECPLWDSSLVHLLWPLICSSRSRCISRLLWPVVFPSWTPFSAVCASLCPRARCPFSRTRPAAACLLRESEEVCTLVVFSALGRLCCCLWCAPSYCLVVHSVLLQRAAATGMLCYSPTRPDGIPHMHGYSDSTLHL